MPQAIVFSEMMKIGYVTGWKSNVTWNWSSKQQYVKLHIHINKSGMSSNEKDNSPFFSLQIRQAILAIQIPFKLRLTSQLPASEIKAQPWQLHTRPQTNQCGGQGDLNLTAL